jgi:hypothetical protein
VVRNVDLLLAIGDVDDPVTFLTTAVRAFEAHQNRALY